LDGGVFTCACARIESRGADTNADHVQNQLDHEPHNDAREHGTPRNPVDRDAPKVFGWSDGAHVESVAVTAIAWRVGPIFHRLFLPLRLKAESVPRRMARESGRKQHERTKCCRRFAFVRNQTLVQRFVAIASLHPPVAFGRQGGEGKTERALNEIDRLSKTL
jgi:hypothetical protein